MDHSGSTATLWLSKVIPGTFHQIERSHDLGRTIPFQPFAGSGFTVESEALNFDIEDPNASGDAQFHRLRVEAAESVRGMCNLVRRIDNQSTERERSPQTPLAQTGCPGALDDGVNPLDVDTLRLVWDPGLRARLRIGIAGSSRRHGILRTNEPIHFRLHGPLCRASVVQGRCPVLQHHSPGGPPMQEQKGFAAEGAENRGTASTGFAPVLVKDAKN